MYILNRCVFFVEREREKEHGSQIRHTGQEYETVQAVNAVGRQITARLITPSDNSDPVTQCERLF